MDHLTHTYTHCMSAVRQGLAQNQINSTCWLLEPLKKLTHTVCITNQAQHTMHCTHQRPPHIFVCPTARVSVSTPSPARVNCLSITSTVKQFGHYFQLPFATVYTFSLIILHYCTDIQVSIIIKSSLHKYFQTLTLNHHLSLDYKA